MATDCIIARRGSRQTVIYYVWNRYNRVSTTRYRWNRYNVNSTTTYYWDRYNLVETKTYAWNRYDTINIYNKVISTEDGVVNSNYNYWYSYDNIANISINGVIFIGLREKLISTGIFTNCWIAVSANPTSIYYVTSYNKLESDRIEFHYKNRAFIEVRQDMGDFIDVVTSTSSSQYPSDGASGDYWYVYDGSTTEYSKGPINVGSISSTNRSAYPDNNYQGNYWYVYDRSSTSYSKGSANGSVTSTNRTQYPDNGRSGSYWYVYSSSSVSYTQGSYIDQVTSTSRNSFPDNNYQDNYWYVYQGTSQDTITSQASLNSILSE